MDELDVILESGERGGDKRPRRLQTPAGTPATGRAGWGWLIVLGIVIGAVLLGLQLAQQNRVQPKVGDTAPLFSLITFDGTPISLESLRGKIVVVNFWASWCAPCHEEAADLQSIAEDYQGKNVVMVGVNWLDTESDARGYMAKYGITYVNGPDVGEKIAKSYRIQAAPENYVLDRNGVVADMVIGPVTYEHLSAVLDRLIAAGGAS